MIREAKVEDLLALEPGAREFYASSRFLGSFSIDRFCEIWSALMGNGGVIFVDEREAGIAGAMGGFLHRDLYSEAMIAEEMFWFVRDVSRVTSGPRLYRAFESWAKDRGAMNIQMVHLLDLNPEKVGNFYRRIGFEPIETRYQKSLA